MPLTNGDVTFGAQFLGTISVVVFVFVVSLIVFQIIKNTVGLRISKEAERLGTDKAEVGVIADGIRDSKRTYSEFTYIFRGNCRYTFCCH